MEKVSVKIYGQEYTVTGEKTQSYMARVAAYVDEKMKQLSGVLPNGSVSELASLAAVNIADELFTNEYSADEVKNRNEQLENDTQHYISLWEEAKKSFLHYKEESQNLHGANDELQGRFDSTRDEAERLTNLVHALEDRVNVLEGEKESRIAELLAREVERDGFSERIRELESKNREIESGFFDLQMENIQLKGEIERYRRMVE
ncbi:MAG: cell division protein ZapA [Clostridiales Family XIII bacterium]|jgi:cell division protein ZapA|nr:cell division protein ZapA [Clostridiales Family XIII bacterium]